MNTENAPTNPAAKEPFGDPAGRVADTIEAAAGMTDYSISFLQRLKANGCAAFRGGRVYVDQLETYYAEHEAECEALERECEEIDGLDADIKRERIRKLRFANDVEQKKYFLRETVLEKFEQVARELNNELGVLLVEQAPRIFAGKSEPEIRAEAEKIRDAICAKLHADAAWTKS